MWLKSVLVLMVITGCLAVPQGRFRSRQQPKQEVLSQQASSLDPIAVEDGMSTEHAKLIENLQRLKRTLDQVKERVGKGTYGQSHPVDMSNPEGAIVTVLKSFQEQGHLFAMINDMLKAGSEVKNQTEKVQAMSKLEQEAAIAEKVNQIALAPPSPSAIPSPSSPMTVADPEAVAPTTSRGRQYGRGTSRTTAPPKKEIEVVNSNNDYQYHYRDDANGVDQYDYDAGTTTTSTTTRRPRRLRGRITRSEYS